MAYTYVAVDATDGSRLGELPCISSKLTRQLSGAGNWEAQLQLNSSDAMQRLSLIDNTTPNAIEVVVHRNNGPVPIYCGYLTDREYDSTKQQIKISGRESWCYFDRRLIDQNLTYTAVDQGAIVLDMLSKAALPAFGDWRVDLPRAAAVTTGIVRTKSYATTDGKPYSEAIEELSAMANGFQFSLDGYWSGNTLRHVFNFGYPLLGVRGGLLVGWDLPGSIAKYRWLEQGAGGANEVWGIGDDGSGHVKLQRVKQLALNQPLLQVPFSYRAEANAGSLSDATTQQSLKLVNPVIGAYITVVGAIRPAIGEFGLGDDVSLQFNDPRFKNVAQVFQLIGWTITTPTTGQPEVVDLAVQ